MAHDTTSDDRAFGRLEAQVENLIRSWAEQDRKATEGRRELYARFERLSGEFSEVKGTVAQIGKEVADIKPAVRRFEDSQQRIEGAKSLGRFLKGVVVLGAGGIGWLVNQWMGGSPPHH